MAYTQLTEGNKQLLEWMAKVAKNNGLSEPILGQVYTKRGGSQTFILENNWDWLHLIGDAVNFYCPKFYKWEGVHSQELQGCFTERRTGK